MSEEKECIWEDKGTAKDDWMYSPSCVTYLHCVQNTRTGLSSEFVYCPYCGKKVKVIHSPQLTTEQ